MSRVPADPLGGVMPPIPGLAFRPFDRQRDYPAVAELMSIANRNDGVDWLPTAEGLRHEWEHHPGFDLERDVLVAEIDDALIGVVDHSSRQRGERVFHHVNPVVHPDLRHRGVGRRRGNRRRAGGESPALVPSI